jgi:nitroimidazol reductase NimA-like FMN-containing flavoprotein (pyridoxamine 5'-phosphate oxidase superfamily)
MRRVDKEITDRGLIDGIIKKCQVCRLGLSKGNTPYIVPVSFGYDGNAIYFHTATVGRKIDFITANPKVCFEFEYGVSLMPNENNACNWTFSYQCVMGEGTVSELCHNPAKQEAIQQIMKQYSDRAWEISFESMEAIKVWKIDIERMSGKKSKDY